MYKNIKGLRVAFTHNKELRPLGIANWYGADG
jgi:hypothetical protein